MIGGLVRILLFQELGEIVSRFVLPLIPGPVIGLLLLLAFLVLREEVPSSVDVIASTLTRYLGVLFVPAAVGVVTYWPNVRANAWPVIVALFVSVVATIAVTAVVLKLATPARSDPDAE